MIKLEHVVLASPEQMKFIIEGMRNPMNSWEKSDSRTCRQDGAFCMECEHKNDYCLGENDHSLMQRLSNAGTDHRKFMRMLPVYVRITAPLYWWKEFDTYKVGTVANSCSTMHKIQAKEFTMDDFSCEHIHIRIWLQNPLSILCASCYTIRATQSNNEIAFEGITLVKSVFSFTRTLERRRDCVATIRDALFRCVSQIGAHFLFALNSYLSMERVIIWERNQIKTFRVS